VEALEAKLSVAEGVNGVGSEQVSAPDCGSGFGRPGGHTDERGGGDGPAAEEAHRVESIGRHRVGGDVADEGGRHAGAEGEDDVGGARGIGGGGDEGAGRAEGGGGGGGRSGRHGRGWLGRVLRW
jgi:hypothetical protein